MWIHFGISLCQSVGVPRTVQTAQGLATARKRTARRHRGFATEGANPAGPALIARQVRRSKLTSLTHEVPETHAVLDITSPHAHFRFENIHSTIVAAYT